MIIFLTICLQNDNLRSPWTFFILTIFIHHFRFILTMFIHRPFLFIRPASINIFIHPDLRLPSVFTTLESIWSSSVATFFKHEWKVTYFVFQIIHSPFCGWKGYDTSWATVTCVRPYVLSKTSLPVMITPGRWILWRSWLPREFTTRCL